jgi:hypothetical protein
MPHLRLAVAACALAVGSLSAQAPAGYHVGASVAVPDTLLEVFAGGRFRATVNRVANTPAERELLTLAERLYPAAERILASARDPKHRQELTAVDTMSPPPGERRPPRAPGSPADRWWFDTFDETWMPFAVTGTAVNYYLGRLRDLAAGHGPFFFRATDPPDHGAFDYRATVRQAPEAGVAYVVELRITWDYWCGDMCAVSFTHTRMVWFDANRKILRITGDGRPQVIVS